MLIYVSLLIRIIILFSHLTKKTGKNFVVQFIANTLFARGVRSKFFKLFIASRDFPHNDKLDEYRETIIKTIESTVSQCHTNLFVFDETDKLPIGLIDTIKAYIDFYQEVSICFFLFTLIPPLFIPRI